MEERKFHHQKCYEISLLQQNIGALILNYLHVIYTIKVVDCLCVCARAYSSGIGGHTV